MQSTVIGVSRISGKAKSSGQPYDMARAYVLQPIKPSSRENFSLVGYGYEIAEVAMRVEALDQFAGIKFPAVLDLETDMEPRNGKLEAIVIGIRQKSA